MTTFSSHVSLGFWYLIVILWWWLVWMNWRNANAFSFVAISPSWMRWKNPKPHTHVVAHVVITRIIHHYLWFRIVNFLLNYYISISPATIILNLFVNKYTNKNSFQWAWKKMYWSIYMNGKHKLYTIEQRRKEWA